MRLSRRPTDGGGARAAASGIVRTGYRAAGARTPVMHARKTEGEAVMATVELRFSALPEHVRTARLVAAAVARRAGVDEAVLDEVRLAVGEACTRAVGGIIRMSWPTNPAVALP